MIIPRHVSLNAPGVDRSEAFNTFNVASRV
jgi:hypothetical protein